MHFFIEYGESGESIVRKKEQGNWETECYGFLGKSYTMSFNLNSKNQPLNPQPY
jgi:hypothetical protein